MSLSLISPQCPLPIRPYADPCRSCVWSSQRLHRPTCSCGPKCCPETSEGLPFPLQGPASFSSSVLSDCLRPPDLSAVLGIVWEAGKLQLSLRFVSSVALNIGNSKPPYTSCLTLYWLLAVSLFLSQSSVRKLHNLKAKLSGSLFTAIWSHTFYISFVKLSKNAMGSSLINTEWFFCILELAWGWVFYFWLYYNQ
jgi:hypothetical protein